MARFQKRAGGSQRRRLLVLVVGVLALASPCFAGAADWPQYHFNAARDGFNPAESTISTANVAQLGLSWRRTISAAPVSPPVEANGVVYVGSNDGNLYALNALNGAIVWAGPTGASIPFAPAIAGGMVYVGSDDTKVYAFPSSCSTPCQPVWTFQTSGRISAPPAVAGGVVYVGAGSGANGDLWALDAITGGLIWQAPTTSSPMGVAVSDGFVYAGADSLLAYPTACANPCSPAWIGAGGGPPSISGGIVYDPSSFGSGFFSYPESCTTPCSPLLTYATTNSSNKNPAIADGLLFLSGSEGSLFGFPATSCTPFCAPTWTTSLGGFISAPGVANGILFVGTDSALRAFDASSGATLATLDTAGMTAQSPAIANGAIYVSTFAVSSGLGKVSAYILNPVDSIPPELSIPSDFTTVAFDNSGANVSYSASATDNVDDNPSVSCNPASGSLFPIGTTTVSCTASDFSGNTTTGTFKVTVLAPWHFTLQPDKNDTVVPKTGAVTISGTVSCNRSAQGIFLSGQLNQVVAHRATLTGSFFASIDCTAPSSRWRASVLAANGPFNAGSASLNLSAFGCELTCDGTQLTQTVTLRGTH